MLSDVLIIKMGQYIPLDPLTMLNGMMINYIIKRSCATHLWAWNLRLKIKQQPTIIISCLKTSSYPVGEYAQGSPCGILPVHICNNKIFRKPNSLCFCRTSCCILCRCNIPREKSSKRDSYLTSLPWVSPFRVEERAFTNYMGYNFLKTTFCFPCMFEISEGSKSNESPGCAEKVGSFLPLSTG